MLNKINNASQNSNNAFANFRSASSARKGIRTFRYHNSEPPSRNEKIRAAAGSIIGTAIPLIYFAKKQNGKIESLKQLFNIKYNLKEMLSLTTGSIAGGVLLGMIGEKKHKHKKKINEGIFQFMNTAIPAVFTTLFLKFSNKNKILNKPLGKITGITASLAAGMYTGAKISNLVTDPKDIHPDRKLTIKDAAANIDDLIGALVLAKFPVLDKLEVEKALPAVYSWCGYRAGQNS